jgi:hypothetical protein
MVKTRPIRPAQHGMETQRSVFAITDSQNDRRHNLSQRYSATGRFQTYLLTLRHCRIIIDCTTQKELAIYKIHKIRYITPPENPDTLKTTQIILRNTQTTKKETATEKEIFLLQISSKDIRLQILQDPTNSVLQRAR